MDILIPIALHRRFPRAKISVQSLHRKALYDINESSKVLTRLEKEVGNANASSHTCISAGF